MKRPIFFIRFAAINFFLMLWSPHMQALSNSLAVAVDEDVEHEDQLSYDQLGVYFHLLHLRALYEELKFKEPDNYFAIEKEQSLITNTVVLLKKVVKELHALQHEEPEIAHYLIQLFGNYYNFNDPEAKVWSSTQLFEKYNQEIEALLDADLDKAAKNDRSLEPLCTLKKNLCALNNLVCHRIQQGIVHVKCHPQSTIKLIKKRLLSFVHGIESLPLPISSLKKGLSWWSSIKNDPGKLLIPLMALFGIFYIFKKQFLSSRPKKRTRESVSEGVRTPHRSFTPEVSREELRRSRPLEGKNLQSARGSLRESTRDLGIGVGGHVGIPLIIVTEPNSRVEEEIVPVEDAIIVDPSVYDQFKSQIDACGDSVSVGQVVTLGHLGRHESTLLNIVFKNLDSPEVRQLYAQIKRLALE